MTKVTVFTQINAHRDDGDLVIDHIVHTYFQLFGVKIQLEHCCDTFTDDFIYFAHSQHNLMLRTYHVLHCTQYMYT